MEREHDQDRDQSLQPLGVSRDSMRQALIYALTKAICFADSAMIMHVVPENAEVSSCGLRNISRVAVQCIWRRAGDGRTIIYIYIYRLRTFNSSMWGSLRLAPIMIYYC